MSPLVGLSAEDKAKMMAHVNAGAWAEINKLQLPGGDFSYKGREFQPAMYTCNARRQVDKKGAQMGITERWVIKTVHGMITGRYKKGALYLFPTERDVTEFSKARFGPLIDSNPCIRLWVKNSRSSTTDAVQIKRIGKSHLYLHGARVSQKIGGIRTSSSALKSKPVDFLGFDEFDEMNREMVVLAGFRTSDSDVAQEAYFSTPSIPDFGVDKLYTESDQRVWLIKCKKCGKETCLEMEFPECLEEIGYGRNKKVIRRCIHCRDQEIFPRDGHWVVLYPDRSEDLVGWWISQLFRDTVKMNPKAILEAYLNPPEGDIGQVYNSMLGMAHIEAENQLTVAEVFACCGSDAMEVKHDGPSAMGVDVGKHKLHVVIGIKPDQNRKKLTRVAEVGSFEDLHDLAQRFNVKCAVIDAEPETHKVREFQAAEPYSVYLCDYQERLKAGKVIDDRKGLITLRRTEIFDRTHDIVTPDQLEIPRQCEAIRVFAKQMSNAAKVLIEDPETGSRRFTYKKRGAEHYRNAFNYFTLACDDYVVVPLCETRTRFSGFSGDSKEGYYEDWDPLEEMRG